MHRPLIRASMVTLLFVLVWSSLLPVAAAPPTTIPPPEAVVSNHITDNPIASENKSTHYHSSVNAVTTNNGFDGSFSTPSSQTGFLPGPVSMSGSGIVTKTMVVPAGFIRDSLRVDVSITNYKIPDVRAELELRPLGDTEWSRHARLLENPGTEGGNVPPVTTTVTQKHVTLGNRVPVDTPMELLLQCWGSYLASFDCTWSNFTFFEDISGWSSSGSLPNVYITTHVQSQTIGGISSVPERGAFLAFGIDRGRSLSGASKATYRSPQVTLPPIASTDVITAGLWWARNTVDPDPDLFLTGVDVQFRPVDNDRVAYRLIDIPNRRTEQGIPIDELEDWTYAESGSLTNRLDEFSGQSGWIEIVKQVGQVNHTFALDDIQLYLNGEPIWTKDTFFDLTVTDSEGQTVDALALNSDGWPATNATTGAIANPITVTVTISNITDAPVTYNPQLIIGERDGPARFYVFDQPSSPQCLPRVEFFSSTFFEDGCSVYLEPGRARTFTWGLWIQPSDSTTLSVTAQLREGTTPITSRSRTVDIPQAAIHPVVFLPGLGATIPPTNTGNPDDVLWIGNSVANYNTFYEYLERMGYERDKTYFLFPYDWLRSTMEAASYLQPKLISWAVIAGNSPGVGRDPISNRVTFDLVGHSTGNLVARAYVQGDHWPGDTMDNVNKWVSIAGPLQGVIKGYQALEGMRPEFGMLEVGLDSWINQRSFEAGYHTYVPHLELSIQGKYLFLHDPEDGLTILPEFLPTYGDYLFDEDGIPHRYGRLANPLLEDAAVVNGTLAEVRQVANGTDKYAMQDKVYDPYLHNLWVVEPDFPREPIPEGFQTTYYGLNTPAKMALLESRVGADNTCIVYGGADIGDDTIIGFNVYTPGIHPPHWLTGRRNTERSGIGDGLIPNSSANPLNAYPDGIWVVDVPDQNRFELEGTLARQISHTTIVGEPMSISATTQCLTNLAIPFLSEAFPGPQTATQNSPTEQLDRSLLIYASGPVELLLTDAQGRRIGYDPNSDTVVQEIPLATYYRDTTKPGAYLFIYDTDLGAYDITVMGTGGGDYEVVGWYEDNNAVVDIVHEAGTTNNDQIDQIDITVPENTSDVPHPPDVQVGPDRSVTVGQSVTFDGRLSDINPDDTHTIAWDFGDRTTSDGTLTPEHTYIATGQYTATLTITDSTNFVVSDTLLVDVTGPALAPLSFTEPVTYPFDVGPYGALTVADGNNDTIPDIIGSNGILGGRQVVSALSGNGDGTFDTPAFIELDSVHGVAVADFDGDQLADMALAHQVSLFILPGRGVGQWPRFDPGALRYTSESFRSVITADFNGDGRPDLATSNIATRDVEIWYGNGDGTFQESVTYAVGALPFSLVSSDLNGDGQPDLLIANAGDNSVSVLMNTGNQFTTATIHPVGTYPMMVTAADFNGDGAPDLATANGRDDTISILFNDGTGQLQSALSVPIEQHPHSIITGDLNSDGAIDIIVGTNRTVDTFLGYGDGTFHTAHSYAIDGAVVSMDVADLDVNGNDDLVVLNMEDGEANVFLQR